jgi:leucyl-tRNA synthetase
LVVGEILRRTENVIQVGTAAGVVTVEVPVDAVVEIPSIPGVNDVNQLRHHLEVQRMSKSKGNVVNPDDLVTTYGADTLRTYIMFAFDWQKGGPWDSRGIVGAHRFIEDVWRLGTTAYTPGEVSEDATTGLRRLVHQTIQKVEGDILGFKFNTAVAALMTLRNELGSAARTATVTAEAFSEGIVTMVTLLAPIAPHVAEELWHLRGHTTSVHLEPWPVADPEVARDETVTMVIQVNGKVRDRVEVPVGIDAAEAERLALAAAKVAPWIEPGVKKVIARPPALVNIVV